MDLELFLASLGMTFVIVFAALLYLRGAMRRVILDLCGSERAADFWLRTADALAFSSSLLLVLTFGWDPEPVNRLSQLRTSMALALLGLVITLLVVAITVGKTAAPRRETMRSGLVPGSAAAAPE